MTDCVTTPLVSSSPSPESCSAAPFMLLRTPAPRNCAWILVAARSSSLMRSWQGTKVKLSAPRCLPTRAKIRKHFVGCELATQFLFAR